LIEKFEKMPAIAGVFLHPLHPLSLTLQRGPPPHGGGIKKRPVFAGLFLINLFG